MRILVASLLLLFSTFANGGEALVWAPPTRNITGANIGSGSFRLEFRIRGYSPQPSTATMAYLDLANLIISNYASRLEIEHRRGGICSFLTSEISPDMLIRIQVNAPLFRIDCEKWNADGSGYVHKIVQRDSWNSFSTANGNLTGLSSNSPRLDFMRAYTSVVAVGSRPPTTADVGDYFDWKFDGNGNDSSGNGRTVNASGATFEDTPHVPPSVIAATSNTPSWAPFRPLRAGHVDTLDGTKSFSLADASADVTCRWAQIDHAAGEPRTSQVRWGDRSDCTPEVSGLVFGPYKFRLTVMDTDGLSSTADLEAGAVAYDDNGVVIYPDARLNTLLGPAKVLGMNDSDWYDERHIVMAQANWNNYEINGGSWLLEQEKRNLNGIPRNGTVYVSNGSNKIYGTDTNFLVNFCNGVVGPAVAGVLESKIWIPTAATQGINGTNRVVGSCQSDTELTLGDGNWDAGTISSPGVIWGTIGLGQYTAGTGTIYVTAGANKVYGIGTHFLAQFCLGSVGSALNQPRINFTTPAGVAHSRAVSSCQSDTEVTLGSAYPGTTIDSPGVGWFYDDNRVPRGEWRSSADTNINYYSVDLAHYTLYYRTGWIKARDAARWLSEKWSKSRASSNGAAGRSFSMTGPVLRFLIDPAGLSEEEVAYFWDKWKYNWAATVPSAYFSDLRDSSYITQGYALLALFHPDPTYRASRRAYLKALYDTWWKDTQQPDGSFFERNISTESVALNDGRVMLVEHGSPTVTKYSGADFPIDFCTQGASTTTGTVAVTNGSTAITGANGLDFTGLADRGIFIRGTLGGVPYSQANRIASVSGSTATLYWPWPGDTGAGLTHRIFVTGSGESPIIWRDIKGFAPTNSAGVQVETGVLERGDWYWCTVVNGTTLTLDKPYTGDSTNPYRRMARGVAGRGTQPFYHGITGWAFDFAAQALDGYEDTTAAGYRAMIPPIRDYLFSSPAKKDGGLIYHTGYDFCYPASVQPNICAQCSNNSCLSYAVEANKVFPTVYKITGNPSDLAIANEWFASQFSNSAYPSYLPGNGNIAGLLLTQNWSLSTALTNKSYGQTFGVGSGHVTPSERVGGPAPAVPREVRVAVGYPFAYGATAVRVAVIQADGSTVSATCETSPCAITGDFRAGGILATVTYLSGDQPLVSSSSPMTIQ